MTFTDDFIPAGDSNVGAGPNYPVFFGITLTPIISGALLAIFGLVGASAIFFYLVQPEWETNQKLESTTKEKQDKVAQQGAIRKQIEKAKVDLETAQKQRQDVLSLFANETTLKTLLLDINRQIEGRNAGVDKLRQDKLAACPILVRNNVQEFEKSLGDLVVKSKLKKFIPDPKLSAVIADNSYGSLVNNKLKRQAISLEFEGNFNQTQSILRSIERLQPLLVLKELAFTLGDGQGKAPGQYFQIEGNTVRLVAGCQPEPKITTAFQLEALIPLTTEESATASQAKPK